MTSFSWQSTKDACLTSNSFLTSAVSHPNLPNVTAQTSVCNRPTAPNHAGNHENLATTFGAHAFVWTAEWDSAGAEAAIGGAASCGLDFVEIPLLDLDAFPLDETRALVDGHGVAVTASLGLPADRHLPRNPDGALEFLARAIDLTAALGADTLTGALYTHLGTLTGKPPAEEEIAACATVLKRAAQIAAERGVSLGI